MFKLSCNLFLTHLRAQILYYELKVDLSPVMLKEIFHDSFENFEITSICMENHASVTGWQKLFFSYKCFQLWRPLQSLLLRFSGYLFLIHSFSLCWQNFSKVNCFRCYWKLITWSSHAKSLFIYYSYASLNYFLVDISLVLFFFLITFLQCTQVHLELNWWWWQCQKLSTSWSQLTKREMMSILTSKLHL